MMRKEKAKNIIMQTGRPMLLREISAAMGYEVPSKEHLNLRFRVSRDPTLVGVMWRGHRHWWLADQPPPPDDGKEAPVPMPLWRKILERIEREPATDEALHAEAGCDVLLETVRARLSELKRGGKAWKDADGAWHATSRSLPAHAKA